MSKIIIDEHAASVRDSTDLWKKFAHGEIKCKDWAEAIINSLKDDNTPSDKSETDVAGIITADPNARNTAPKHLKINFLDKKIKRIIDALELIEHRKRHGLLI